MMRPGVELRLGDGIAGLGGLNADAADVAIVDPPWDRRAHRTAVERRDWREGARKLDGALPFDPLDEAAVRDVGADLARVTRRWIVVFAPERQLELWAGALEAGGARFVRVGVAVRTNPRPQMRGDRPGPAADHLVIAHGGGEAMRWNGGGRPARWESPPARFDTGGKLLHPCQKPLRLLEQLVRDFSEPGELVLDPFVGAGTAAVAAKELGRGFAGWEIRADYHGAALRRIEATQEQIEIGGAPRRVPGDVQGELPLGTGGVASAVGLPAIDRKDDSRSPRACEDSGNPHEAAG